MRISIDFASREYIQVRMAVLAVGLCIALGIFVFVGLYGSYRGSVARCAQLVRQAEAGDARLMEVEKRLAEARNTVRPEEVKAASQQVEFINAAIRRKAFSWTLFLNRMEEVLPDGVGVTSINPDFVSLNVGIAGTALDMKRLTEFIERLTKSPYFEDVPPVFHTSEVVVDKDIGKTLQKFNLQIHYNPEGAKRAASARGGEGKH
jgi:type IV pilus assembly protein PilN